MNRWIWYSMFIQALMVCGGRTNLLEIHAVLCKVPAFKKKKKQRRQVETALTWGTPGRAVRERMSGFVCCVTHSPLCIMLDTHIGEGGACIYMHVWCPARGHSITACWPPRCARSPFSGVRHHSAGVSSNLIQEALQGVLFLLGGGNYPQAPGLGISRLRAAWISRGRQIIPPCWVLPQI